MIHPALAGLIDRYQPQSSKDYQNAVREIAQEIALLGLWRTPFYEHAAFYGGSALQIFHGVDSSNRNKRGMRRNDSLISDLPMVA